MPFGKNRKLDEGTEFMSPIPGPAGIIARPYFGILPTPFSWVPPEAPSDVPESELEGYTWRLGPFGQFGIRVFGDRG